MWPYNIYTVGRQQLIISEIQPFQVLASSPFLLSFFSLSVSCASCCVSCCASSCATFCVLSRVRGIHCCVAYGASFSSATVTQIMSLVYMYSYLCICLKVNLITLVGGVSGDFDLSDREPSLLLLLCLLVLLLVGSGLPRL